MIDGEKFLAAMHTFFCILLTLQIQKMADDPIRVSSSGNLSWAN
jgi:hypothetical protein